MRPIVNTSEEDRATDIGNMHKTCGQDRAGGSGDILADINIHVLNTERWACTTNY